MRIQIFQHVPFEGPGTIAPFFHAQGIHQVHITHFYRDEQPLSTTVYDFLVIMGGPMGVHDESRFSWMTREKRAIEEALAQEKRVLGICLGAQMIAHVAGAQVGPLGYREIGWHPVSTRRDWQAGVFGDLFPERFVPLHWHGDTFDLPPTALALGSSDACRQQGFALGQRVVGLQFHLEFNASSIRRLCRNASDELASPGFVQSEEEMLAQAWRFDDCHQMMSTLLQRMIRE